MASATNGGVNVNVDESLGVSSNNNRTNDNSIHTNSHTRTHNRTTPAKGAFLSHGANGANQYLNGGGGRGGSVDVDSDGVGRRRQNWAIWTHLCTRKTLLALLIGQTCSCLLACTALTNVYLIDVHLVALPNAQNFAFYLTLCAVFTSLLALRRGDRNLFPVLRLRGWKYVPVAVLDVESSYLVLRAYQYTNVASVQLLDCFALPTVLSLSWLILHVRFRLSHILAVSISLLGISCLVWADIHADGRYMGSGRDRFIGDMLCLAGAFLYGVAAVAAEFAVKTFDVAEYLGMVGLTGSFVSGLQTIALEYSAVLDAPSIWNNWPVLLLLALYVAARLGLQTLSAMVLRSSSATALCLSLGTTDFYILVAGVHLFHYQIHPGLHALAYAFVMGGIILFFMKETSSTGKNLFYRSLVREQMTITTDLELLAGGGGCGGGGGGGCGAEGTVVTSPSIMSSHTGAGGDDDDDDDREPTLRNCHCRDDTGRQANVDDDDGVC